MFKFFLILIFITLISCNKENKKIMNYNQKIIVEFQHFEACPNGPKLLKNLKEAIKGIEDKVDINEVLINTPELAKKHNFRGSPTILVDGSDLLNMPIPKEPSLSCRLYPNGLPSLEFIREYLNSKINDR